MDYMTWRMCVEAALEQFRPDVTIQELDRNALFAAYQSGLDPEAFAIGGPFLNSPVPQTLASKIQAMQKEPANHGYMMLMWGFTLAPIVLLTIIPAPVIYLCWVIAAVFAIQLFFSANRSNQITGGIYLTVALLFWVCVLFLRMNPGINQSETSSWRQMLR